MNTRTRYSRFAILYLVVLLAALPVLSCLVSTPAQAATSTIYVDASATTGGNDGTTWANAYTTLQAALADSAIPPASGDDVEILVAAGVYYPDEGGSATDNDRDETFQLVTSVAIYGGYPAGGGTRDPDTNVTILSGDIGKDDKNDDGNFIAETWADIGAAKTNSIHVVTGANDATLDGVTITAGQATGTPGGPGVPDPPGGGGMYNNSSSPTLTNVTFSGNESDWGGGGMYNDSSNPTLTDVTFTGNKAPYPGIDYPAHGGGMYNNSSSPTLTDVIFINNQAEVTGGGMYNNNSSSPTLTNVTFDSNQADSSGGGMYNFSSSPVLNEVTFSNNQATYTHGGGMYNNDSSPTLTNVIFSSNEASRNGGGMYNNSSSPTLIDVDFSSNQADDGGGMYNNNSSPTLTNVTFESNTASTNGGGIENYKSSPTLTNVTFSGNTATQDGGGMYTSSSTSHPVLNSVTFEDNTAQNGGGMYNIENLATLTNVDFSRNTASLNGGGMYNNWSDATLTDVTFTGNLADNQHGGGGGLYNTYSSPTLTNVDFSSNEAANDGGGIENYKSNPTLTNVTFSGNKATGNGGGVYNDSSNPTLTNVTFSGNRANEWGGGLRNIDSSPTLSNVTFSGNSTLSSGGGIANHNSNPTLTNVTFESNTATGNGGGIENYKSSPTLTNVTFESNTATGNGGGVYDYESSPTLSNVTFSGNQASTNGGGMHSIYDLATLTNVVFVGNVATSAGGGLYNHSSDAELTNVTFAGNQASDKGGGIYNNSSAPTLHNSLLWGNAATTDGSQVYNESSDPTYRYSLVEGETAAALNASGSDGADNLNSANPLFVRDPGPGSDTTWGTTDDDYGDLHLQFGSPAIDAGYNNYLDETSTGIDMNGDGDTDDIISIDLDDRARIFNTTVDLGAYEYPLSMRKTVTTNTPAPGDTIGYTLTIASGMNTSSAIISDTLPAELSLVGQVTINPGNTQTTPSNLPRLAEGVSIVTSTTTVVTYQVQVADGLLPGTVLNNTAEVSSDEVATPVTATIPITIAAAPAIEVSKIASTSSAEVGDEITYTYRVTNTGNIDLTDISAVDDKLGSLDVGDTLAVGQSMMTTRVYTPTADDMPGPIINTVTVTGTWSYDGTVDQVTDTDSATVALGNAQSGIAVQKTASVSSARPGDVITYTYRVTNTGTMLLNPVTAEDDLLGTVTLDSNSLASGETTTGTLSYAVVPEDLPGPLVNTVTATGTLPGGNNVSATATVSVDLDAGENAPTITTDPATNVLTTSATLHATVNPNDSDTTVTFAWGEAAGGSYPNKQIIAQTFSGTRAQTTSLTIGSLTPDTTYSYTATARNANGSATSNEQRFTTLAADGPAYASTPAPGSTLDAGTVAVSATGTVDLVVREVGSEDLTISLPTSMLSGVGAGSFSVQNANNFPLTIANGSGITKTITIACTPPAVGVQQATLTLETNDPAHASVSYPLRCTGTQDGPALTIYLPLIFK